MAFKLGKANETIKVVVSKDSCVNCDADQYKEYLKTLDESHLNLNGEPTRFILKKILDYKSHQKLLNSQMSVDAQTKAAVYNSGYILDELRIALVGIENPLSLPEEDHIKFSKDSDGYASKELVAALYSYGVAMNLLDARAASSVGDKETADLKKS